MDIAKVEEVTPILYEHGFRILQTYRFAKDDAAHVNKLLGWMSPVHGARVIDMGCGMGEVARLMMQDRPDLEFSLANLSSRQLEFCPPNADLVQCDFRSVPRKSGSYDCATFMFAIGHEEVAEGLKEAFRLLKDDGELFIVDMARISGDGAYMAQAVEYRVLEEEAFRGLACGLGFEELMCILPEVLGNVGPEVCGSDEEYQRIFGDVRPIVWKFRKKSVLERHQNIVLQFSGGKDSVACLLLLREHLHRITVLWLNSGETLPEHVAQMERVRALCPHFVEVRTNVAKSHAEYGYPVDLLPLRNDRHVQFLAQQDRVPLQGFMACCMTNMMQPMHAATVQSGATLIIRGQKRSDGHKSPLSSGDVRDGLEFWFPIEDWSHDEVLDYVAGSEFLPEYFERHHTSLDCWSCTAYLGDHAWKREYLHKHHPEKAAVLEQRISIIRKEIMSELKHMEAFDG